jgi:hypothetical protein
MRCRGAFSREALVPLLPLGMIVDRLARPALSKINNHIHRLLVAAATVALGLACLIVGLAYFASSLWHALVPAIGTIGADLSLGAIYSGLAISLILAGSRLAR